MRYRFVAVALALAVATTACVRAGVGPNFHTMDRDSNACLDRTEFALSAAFDEWDSDLDGDVRRSEFVTGLDEVDLIGDWDANADDRIGPGEFGVDVNLRDYSAWDLDNDGYLDADELFGGLFALWDADDSDYLTIDEAEEGLFSTWDVDGNGCLDRSEYVVGYQYLVP